MEPLFAVIAIPATSIFISRTIHYFIDISEPAIPQEITSFKNLIIIIVIIGPILEELFFRGIPLLLSDNLMSIPFIISIMLFAYAHKPNYSYGFMWIMPLFIFSGVAFSYMALEFGLLWAIIAHMLNNFVSIVYIEVKKLHTSNNIS